jgi:hypothetical protein
MRAVAGPANSQPDGRRYAILAFVCGEDEPQATETAFAALEVLGWIDAEALRSGEITDPEAVPADLRAPMKRARRDGCALVVYDEP